MRRLRLREMKSDLFKYLSLTLKLHVHFNPTIPGQGIYSKEIIRDTTKACSLDSNLFQGKK